MTLADSQTGDVARDGQARRVLLCVTEDWFVLSHFKPLIRALRQVAADVVVVTNDTGRIGEVAALGVRTVAFDFDRKSANPVRMVLRARDLALIIGRERPDVLHLVALKSIVLGETASRAHPDLAVVVHVTGFGQLSTTPTARVRMQRHLTLAAVARALSGPRSHLFVENSDDLQLVAESTNLDRQRSTILGGAGIDPAHFSSLPPPSAAAPIVVAYAGRMLYSKGVDTLVEAGRLARARGAALEIRLYGRSDTGNADDITPATLAAWERDGLANWLGHVDDVRDIWRNAHMAALASRDREGLPRTLLEAAACGRPSVVTDVPGSRHLVRDGREGRVVPPGNAEALAEALVELAANHDARNTMGAAARKRVFEGFAETDVETAIARVYRTMIFS